MLVLLAICGCFSAIFCIILIQTPHVAASPDYLLGLFFWPVLILSGIGLVTSISCGLQSKKPSFFGAAALFLPMVLCGSYGIMTSQNQEQDQLKQWQAVETAGMINPLLFRYHELHPERFHFVGNDDEVTVAGFTDYAASESTALVSRVQVKNGQFLDPWGRKYHLALNRGNEANISLCGWKYTTLNNSGWTVATLTLGADGQAGEVKVGDHNYTTFDDFAASQ